MLGQHLWRRVPGNYEEFVCLPTGVGIDQNFLEKIGCAQTNQDRVALKGRELGCALFANYVERSGMGAHLEP